MENKGIQDDYKSTTVAKLVEQFLRHAKLEIFSGIDNLSNIINVPRVQKPGLAFTEELATPVPNDRVQVFGKTEIVFLENLSQESRQAAVNRFCNFSPCCIFITRDLAIPAELLAECKKKEIPLFRTDISTGNAIDLISRLLRSGMAPKSVVHGVLMEVFSLGVLIIGDAGSGKSESALDLVTRGHRFVADDAITITKFEPDVVIGNSPEMIKNLMEIRGLGIINIRDLFGMGAVRDQKRIELVISLEDWDESKEYDRLGLSEDYHEILGVRIPLYIIPIAAGRNIAILIETAARNFLVKLNYGKPGEEFEKKMFRKLLRKD